MTATRVNKSRKLMWSSCWTKMMHSSGNRQCLAYSQEMRTPRSDAEISRDLAKERKAILTDPTGL